MGAFSGGGNRANRNRYTPSNPAAWEAGAPNDVEEALDKLIAVCNALEANAATELEVPVTQVLHGFAQHDWLTLNSSGEWRKAQADSEPNAEIAGIVLSVENVNDFILRVGGFVPGLTDLQIGRVYFLSAATAGAMTLAAPTVQGEVNKPVLLALSSTTGMILQQRGFVVP